MDKSNSSRKLSNKVAIITGAAQGSGAAIAEVFAQAGADLVLIDLKAQRVQELGERLSSEYGLEVKAEYADVTCADTIRCLTENVASHFGKIDILVNNAGVNVFSDPLSLSDDDWNRCFTSNLSGAWICARSVLPYMLSQGRGSIINIASVHGHKIVPGAFPYSVAKHALIGLTKALAIEYAAQGIRVNSISPGLINTPIADAHFALHDDPAAARAGMVALIPCKRIGEPDEVAETALFLAGDDATFINAADIVIDGGRSQLYHE